MFCLVVLLDVNQSGNAFLHPIKVLAMKSIISFFLQLICITLFAQINVADQQYCGPDQVTFTTTDAGCANYDWYNENNVIIGNGCTVTTSSIAFDQSFTVTDDAVNSTISTGPVYNDPSFSSSTTFNGAGYDQNQFTASFEVKVPLTLESVDVYSVMNNNGNCAQAFLVDLIAPDNSVIETLTPVTTCGAGTEQITLVFNEVLQVGVHKIRIRDNGNKGTSEKFVSFLGGDFSTGGNYDYDYMRVLPDPFLGWYASFFNWQVTIPNVKVVNALDDCQANSCTNKGADFFKEDFGVGTGSVSLPAGLTNYVYNGGTGLVDGQYAVSNNPVGLQGGWHNTEDFTVGDANGRMLVVNASSEPGEFYKTTVSGLCENSYYSFSAQIMNILTETGYCPTTHVGLPINVVFQVEDLNGNIIGRTSTGDLGTTSSPQWNEYSFGFYIPDNLASVNVVLINNYQGGCGNDLAIDDITFSPCGPDVTISTDFTFPACYGDSVEVIGEVGPEIQNPDRQWQVSSDGGASWSDIAGETGETLVVVGAQGNNNTVYRLAVTVAGNISTLDCRIYSNSLTYFSQSCCSDPEVNLSGATTVCPNETVQIDVNLVDVRLDFIISDGINSVEYNDVSDGFSFDVSHSSNTTYTVTSATKVGDPTCIVNISDPFEIAIFESVEISNQLPVCNNTATGYAVSIELMNGDASSYTEVSGQGVIVGSNFVSLEIASGSSYEFKFTDANGCDTVTVSGMHTCNCLTDAGEMGLTLLEVCESSDAVGVHSGGFLDGDDMFEFILHTSNSDVLGTIIERSTTPTFDFDPNTMTAEVTYYMSVVAGNNNGGQVDLNDPCLDVSVGTPIVFYEEGDATLSGGAVICDGESTSLIISITPTSGVFDVVYNANGTNQNLSAISDSQSITVNTSGDFNLISIDRSDLPSCPGQVGGNVEEVVVNGSPQVSGIQEVCNGTATDYTLSFTITGGDNSSYQELSNQGTISNGVFTSTLIASGDSYDFQILDDNGCDTVSIIGSKTCNCLTDAGDMDLTLLSICDGSTATGAHSGEVLDGDDVLEFILHTGNTNSLGTIIDRNTSGGFGFNSATMNPEVTYYISAVAGSNNGSNQVDLADPCLDVAQGTPVRFYEVPEASLSGGAIICEGEDVDLVVSITPTTGVYDIIYMVDGSSESRSGISNGETINVTVTSDYSLVSVDRTNAPSCPGIVNADIASVVVNDSPVNSIPVETCNGTATGYVVTFNVTGGDDSSYEELDGQEGFDINNVFTSQLINEGDSYEFRIVDINRCDTIVVAGDFSCECLSDAGQMELTPQQVCESSEATGVNSGSVLDDNDVLEYVLHTSDTDTLGTIVSRSGNGRFTFDSNTMTSEVTYYLSAIVGDNNGNGQVSLTDPCMDVAIGAPVTFYEEAMASISGGDVICEGETALLTLNIDPSGPKYNVVYSVDGVNQSSPFTGYADGQTFMVSTTSTYQLVSILRVGNPTCPGTVGSNSETVQVNGLPTLVNVVESCNNTSTGYTVSIEIEGGDPSTYQELAGQVGFDGNVFTSQLIDNATGYEFNITDAGGCSTVSVSGLKVCECISDAGSMIQVRQDICSSGIVSSTHLGGQVLDGNDVIEYFLHTDSLDVFGSIIERSETPDFFFDIEMTDPNITYYVSTLVGDSTSDGHVDLTDSCLSMALGSSVKSYRDAALSGTLVINGDSIEHTMSSLYSIPEIHLEDTAQVIRILEGWESPLSWQWFWFDEEADSLVSLGIRFPVTNTEGTTALPPSFDETEYSITYYMVTYNGVCYDTSTAALNLSFDIFIPDAFSPNNDNSFDEWKIKNLDKYPEASVLIYNRWGNVVAELNDISTVPWDGKLDGKALPMGTYYYLLTVEKGTKALSGDVSILR